MVCKCCSCVFRTKTGTGFMSQLAKLFLGFLRWPLHISIGYQQPSLKFKANKHQPLSWGDEPLQAGYQVCIVISCHAKKCTSPSLSVYPTYPIAEKDRRSLSFRGICSWSWPVVAHRTGPPKSHHKQNNLKHVKLV